MDIYLAELLGLHMGDGTIYQTGKVWELRGNLTEKKFYETYVRTLIFKATGKDITPAYRSGGKNGCYGFRCCEREFIDKLVINGAPIGRKSHIAEIPDTIGSSGKLVTAFSEGYLLPMGVRISSERMESE